MLDKTEFQIIKDKRQKGFSLLEVLIVLVVLGILVTIALAGFNNSKNQLQRQSLATQLKTSLERARFDSTKRRASSANGLSRVEIGANYFTLRTDLDLDGVVEATEAQTYNFDPNVAGQVVDNLAFPVTVSFNRSGHVSATDTNNSPVNPVFRICAKNCTVSNSTNSTIISLSDTGTVALLPGGSSVTAVSNPTWVSNVNSNSGINQTVKVESNYSY